MDQIPAGDDLRREDEPPQPADSRERIDWADPAAPDADVEPVPAQYPEPPDDDYSAEIWSPETYVGPPLPAAPRSSGGLVTSILLVVLALGIVGATLWGVNEYRQRAQSQQAALQAIALIGDAAPPEIIQDVQAIQAALTAGNSEEAATRLAALRTTISQKRPSNPETPGLDQGPIPEVAYKDLKADEARFFRQHQELFRRFLLMCDKARQLKENGADKAYVQELRDARDRVLEAARLGLEPQVEKRMGEMLGMLRGQGMPGQRGPGPRGPLGQKAERLKHEVQRAEQQGRDIRPVLALMQKAEQAAQAGNMAAAEKYVDQALTAARQAPRGGFGRRGGGDARGRMMAMRQGPGNPLAPFVRVLLGVMGAEDQNLKIVTDQLLAIRKVVLGEEPETSEPGVIKPLVDKALDEMQMVANRRQELAKTMRGQRGDKPGERPGLPTGPRDRPSPEERKAMFAILFDRISPLLDRLRVMSEDDYHKQKRSLVRELVQAVLEPPRREGPATSRPAELPTDPEQRVRARMIEASPVLKQWELQGKETKEVEALFAQARKALYAKQFAEAEKLVDEARKLLGMDEPPPTTLGPAGRPRTDDGILTDDDVKLDLRSR